jgi:hypothetical protein
MRTEVIGIKEYAQLIKKTERWVQLKCAGGELLPGVSTYQQIGRTWVLYPSGAMLKKIEKYLENN